MKPVTLLFLLILLPFGGRAQVDYSFTAISGTFTPLTSPVTATLTAANPGGRPLLDESFANNVPIGFTFQYNGLNYTNIHLNANGLASLGAGFVANAGTNPGYDSNELRAAAGFRGVTRPVLAPLWDDLAFTGTTGLSYNTTGTAPNRVFTAQWQNMAWQTGTAAVSFQLRLLETSNVIEFVYRQEAGAGSAQKSASIGLTAEAGTPLADDDPGTFLSLASAGSSPPVSSTLETETISTKPATGQTYRFTPLPCAGPAGLQTVTYTTKMAVVQWTARTGATGYQYGIGNLDVPPTTPVSTSQTSFTVANLDPNETYYVYVRNACGSPWRVMSFKTPMLATVPYAEGFEGAVDNALPKTMRREVRSNPFADAFWQTSSYVASATGAKAAVVSAPFVAGQNWLYTPGLSLTGGVVYKIGFSYAATGGVQSLDVRAGMAVGEAAMTTTLFSGTSLVNTAYQSTTATFAPAATGIYYLGFLYKSAVTSGLFMVDNVSVIVDPNQPAVCLNNPLLPDYGTGTTAQIRARNTILATNQISRGATVLYQAGDYVDLLPGFLAEDGADLTAQTGACNN